MHKNIKYFGLTGILLLSFIVIPCHGKIQTVEIKNNGFELVDSNGTPSHWRASSTVYSIDKEHAHTGDSSLHYHNTDPKKYKLCKQTIQLERNFRYQLSAWTKKPNGKKGSRLIVEFYDKDGNYLHGTSVPSSTTKKNKKWSKLQTYKFTLPPKANPKHVNISCYVRKGGTGDAWFDDLKMTKAPLPAIGGIVLAKPNYRGHIEKSKGPIEIKGWTNSHINNHIAIAYLSNNKGNTVNSSKIKLTPNSNFKITVPIKKIEVGKYKLSFFTRSDSTFEPNYSHSWTIEILKKSSKKPQVYVDSHNRLIAHGKAIFPIGIYSHIKSKGRKSEIYEAIDLLNDTPFNTVLSYGIPNKKVLSYAKGKGMYFIPAIYYRKYYDANYRKKHNYKVGDGPIGKLQNKSALLAWYVDDESGPGEILRLESQYQWIKLLDPNHPAYLLTNKPRLLNQYIRTFDVVGSDPYPITKSKSSLIRVSRDTNTVLKQTANSRLMWQVIQVFNKDNYGYGGRDSKTPSPKEVRNMIWQAVDNGANGIILYSLYDIEGRTKKPKFKWHGGNSDRPFKTYWPKVKNIAAELNQWAPVLLSIEKSPKIKKYEITNKDNSWLSMRVATWHGRTFVFACNNTRKEQTARFSVNSDINHVRAIDVLDSKHKDIQAKSNMWQDTFKPLAVKMYELNGEGKKLPKPQDVHPPKK